jgi:hypothetical protein
MNTNTKLHRIERASLVLRAGCTGLSIAVVILALAGTVSVLAGRATSVSYYSQSFDIAGLELGSRLMIAALGIATAAVFLKALYHLRRLSTNYARREIFTGDSARQIRQFGISCILWGVAKIAWAFLPLAIGANPPASTGLSIDSILIGAVVVGISWFAEMASALREENDLTI